MLFKEGRQSTSKEDEPGAPVTVFTEVNINTSASDIREDMSNNITSRNIAYIIGCNVGSPLLKKIKFSLLDGLHFFEIVIFAKFNDRLNKESIRRITLFQTSCGK